MSLPIGNVLGILSDNLRKRKSVLPLKASTATAWADGLDIPYGGNTVIYTGYMYQLIPSISSLAKRMAGYEDSWMTKFFGVGRFFNKIVSLSKFMTHVDSEQQDAYNNVVRNIAKLLMTAGVEFGYLYDKELYTGALVYDQGVDDVFIKHAERVHKVLEGNGVKKVITIDPHTTDMLRSVYPKIIEGYDIEVISYLEVLANANPDIAKQLDADLVIHDSCVYARYGDVVAQPRQLLTNAGARLHEPELSGKLTHCCGGPIESLKPAKAHEIAANRVQQLAECGKNVVTMCPICMVNLTNAADDKIDIKDISEYLVKAYAKD